VDGWGVKGRVACGECMVFLLPEPCPSDPCMQEPKQIYYGQMVHKGGAQNFACGRWRDEGGEHAR